MERVLWNAARRLAMLVAATLAIVGVRFVAGGLARVGALAAAMGGLAFALFAASFVPLALAARSMRREARLPDRPAPARVYRESARTPYADAAREAAESQAIHAAAVAFLLLSMSAALTVVAAASR
jgi:hypothetical protein